MTSQPPRLDDIERQLAAFETRISARKHALDLAAAAVLAVVALAFFAPVLFGPFHLPAGGGDLASFLFPMYRFIAASLSAGDLPLWNPHQYGGAPLAADNQSGLLYPPHLLLFLVWPRFPYAALEWSVALHVWWAGLGMYALLRGWRSSGAGLRSKWVDVRPVDVTPPDATPVDATPVYARTAAASLTAATSIARPADVTSSVADSAVTTSIARPAAILGGVAWMLSDGFVTHIGNLNFNAAAAWLPWALLGLHRAVEAGREQSRKLGEMPFWSSFALPTRRAARLAILGGAALGVGALAGHAQVTFFTAAVLGLYAAWRAVADRSVRPAFALLIVGLVGAGLAAPVLLPALALRPHTVRAAYDYATTLEYSLPGEPLLEWLPSLFAPGLFGRGPAAFWGAWDRVEVGYVGVLPWLLAAAALAGARASRRDQSGDRPWFFASLAVLAFLIALGPSTPVHGWLLGPLDLPFRAPARFVLVADLGVAALAAIGLDALIRARGGTARFWPGVIAMTIGLAGISALVASAALTTPGAGVSGGCPGCSEAETAMHAALWAERGAGMRRAAVALAGLAIVSAALVWLRVLGRLPARLFAGLAVLVLAFDLILLGAGTEIDTSDPSDGYRREVAAAWLAEHAGLVRIDVASGPWQPSAAQVHGLYDIGGVYNPLRLGLYSYTIDGLERRGSAIYNLLGARYVIAAKGAPPSDSEFIRPVFTDDQAADIWENERALPRVLLPTETRVVEDDGAAFEALREPGFDPEQTVVLIAADVDVDATVNDRIVASAGSAEIVDYRSNALAIEAELDLPAWVVLTDIYAPGWSATLDGEDAEIVRADFAFRAVRVPAGAHRIDMRYSPPWWRAGVLLAFAVVMVAGLAWWAAGDDLLNEPERY